MIEKAGMPAGVALSGKPTGTERPTLPERAVFRFSKLGQLISQAVEVRLADLDLTGRRYFVVAGAGAGGPVSQQDLARMLGIDPTTIVAIVDELQAGGFVRRERSTADRRRYELHLTPAGEKVLAAADEAIDEVESEFFRPLAPAERQRFHTTAGKVVARCWP
jgi:MarR family transcriptional regulator, lower aerobic nicotinate degradation pathway regulator